MAYFDSAKNRVLWQRELSELRQERARREQQGFRPDSQAVSEQTAERKRVRQITFRELEQEEIEAISKKQPSRSRTKKTEKEIKLMPEKGMSR